MRHSLYWDDFEKRADETIDCIRNNKDIPIRRVSVFITNKCNLRCKYCNVDFKGHHLPEEKFIEIVEKYGNSSIIHITGGEPSIVKYLYPFIREHGNKYKFHLNTNAIIEPPSKQIKRLKISLDSYESKKWDRLVGKDGAFNLVVNNIKKASKETVVSVTFTLTKENYRDSIEFAKFANKEFNDVYTLFYSVYKGENKQYQFDDKSSDDFFNSVLPRLRLELPDESLCLINETLDNKKRIMQGERFSQNMNTPCYLSLSEKVYDPNGNEYVCSHLYRDNIKNNKHEKHEQCKYGCNQRLAQFNEYVENKLTGTEAGLSGQD